MANVQRRPNILPLLGFACLPVAVSATELRVLGDSGTVATTVELASARYDVTEKRVIVTTRAGNVTCPGGQAAVAGQIGLQVDGSTFAVMSDPPGTAQNVPVDVTLAGGGAYTLAVANATACRSSDLTAANLKLAFDTGTPLTIGEAVYFDTGTRTFDIRVVEPVMCNSYAADATGLSIRLTEANGAPEVIRGFQAVDYQLAGGLLRATSRTEANGARLVQCFSFVDGTLQAPGASPSGSESIFGARFEYEDVSADLEVSVNTASVSLLAGGAQAFQYTLTIANTGNSAATGVRAREYLPALAGSSIVAGGWTCERFAGTSNTNLGCDVASGSGVLNQLTANLAPGERLVYTLNRSVQGGSAGTSLLLGGAAFVNPEPTAPEARPERDYSDNSARVAVALVSNQPPAFAAPMVLAYEDGDAAEPQDPNTASTGQTIPLSFTDTDSSALTIASVTTNSGAGLPATISAPVVSGTAPNFTADLVVPPTAKDKSGSVVITLSISDGSTSVQRTISYDVLPRNDAPDFALASADVAVPTCTAPCAEVLRASFVTGLVPGPAGAGDEASQNTQVTNLDASGRIACSNVPAGFFDRNENPRLIAIAGGYNLSFYPAAVAGTATCEVTVADNGTPAGTRTKSFTITYPAPP